MALFAAAAALAAAGPASAHHSAAMFDRSKQVVLQGTFLSQVYQNPHVWLSFMASPDGQGAAERWDVETVGVGSLTRMGIKRDTLKAGEKVSVRINPLRDGRRGGSMMSITTADGTHYGWKPGQGGGIAPPAGSE